MKDGTETRLLTLDEFETLVSGLTAAQIDKIIAMLESNHTNCGFWMG